MADWADLTVQIHGSTNAILPGALWLWTCCRAYFSLNTVASPFMLEASPYPTVNIPKMSFWCNNIDYPPADVLTKVTKPKQGSLYI